MSGSDDSIIFPFVDVTFFSCFFFCFLFVSVQNRRKEKNKRKEKRKQVRFSISNSWEIGQTPITKILVDRSGIFVVEIPDVAGNCILVNPIEETAGVCKEDGVPTEEEI